MKNWIVASVTIVLWMGAQQSYAGTITYDPSSGLPPESVGWSFLDENNPPSVVTVADGVLRHTTSLENRAYWEIWQPEMPGTVSGAFMESIARIFDSVWIDVSPALRGEMVATVGFGDGTNAATVAISVREDRLWITDTFDAAIADIPFDATVFHKYRVQLVGQTYQAWIDDNLLATGTVPWTPYAYWGSASRIGDHTMAWGGTAEFQSLTLGSISVPEPASFGLLMLGGIGAAIGVARRKRSNLT